jgi:hypothetical protein
MNNSFYALALLLFINFASAQTVYTGIVRDMGSGESIAYVNIGIVNKNSGTVSDANGRFQIALDDKFDDEILKISIIGYKSISYKVSDFKNTILADEVVLLEKNISALKEVVIKNRNLKPGILGNFLEGRTVSAGFVNNILGNEMGMVMKIKKSPTFIEGFHAVIDYNKYEILKFRLNFYEVKNGFPTNSLLDESIIITSGVEKGKMNIDLSEHNIMVNGDFFVSLEWIEGLGEGGLHFLADYTGPPVITRAASQGKWNKQGDLSFGFTISVKN